MTVATQPFKEADFIEKMEDTNSALDELDISGLDWRIEIIPVEQMYMGRYQRPLDERWIRQRVDNFKPWLLGTVTVSERNYSNRQRDEHLRFAVIDGQHRRELALGNGMTHLAAVVFYNLTEAEEAGLFAAFQQERRNITPFQRFQAQIINGNARAKAIHKLVKEQGFELVPSGNVPNTLRAVKLLEDIYDEDPVMLKRLLGLVRRTWKDMPYNNNQQLLRGLASLMRDTEMDEDRFVDRLSSVTPLTILDRAGKLREGRGVTGSLTLFVREALETEYRRRSSRSAR